jgi:methionine-rich copper-binding protein CopC
LITSKTPANGAKNISPGTALQIGFNKSIALNTGNITVFNSSTDEVVEEIPLTTTNTVIRGTEATITPSTAFPGSTAIYLKIDAGTFKDLNNNLFNGLQDKSWSFTTSSAPVNYSGPVIVSTSPVTGSTEVDPFQPLIITFDKSVRLASGALTLVYSGSGFTVSQSVDLKASNTVIHDNIVTITPESSLPSGVKMSILLGSGAFIDSDNHPFKGITSPGTWTFSTAKAPDTTAPLLAGTTPSAGAVGIDPATTLKMQFNEYVKLTGGQLTVKQYTKNTELLSVELSASNTVIDKATVIVTLPQPLPGNEQVYVQLSSDAIADTTGNAFPGITDKRWKFSTTRIITGIEEQPHWDNIIVTADGDYVRIDVTGTSDEITTVSDVMGRSIAFTRAGNEIVFKRPAGLFIIHGSSDHHRISQKFFIRE